MSIYKQNDGPEIKVTIFVADDEIQQVLLSEASAFEWDIQGAKSELEDSILEWLRQYSSGKQPNVILPVHLSSKPLFTHQLLCQLQKVSFGESLTYKQLGESLGNSKGFRAVGNACGRNPCPLFIPCHRILAQNQKIGGFSQGIEIKCRLLRFEKILP